MNGNPKVTLTASSKASVLIGISAWSWYMQIAQSYVRRAASWNIVSAGRGPRISKPSPRRRLTAGATMVWSSVPNEPSSPACGLRPDTARRGRAIPKWDFKPGCRDTRRRDDQVARKLSQRLAQRDMNGDRHDGKRRRPQHHDGLRRGIARRGKFGKIFGMTGMAKTGTVEHVLGNRIGDDRARPARHDVAYRLADRGQGRAGTAVIGVTGLGGCDRDRWRRPARLAQMCRLRLQGEPRRA